MVTVDGIEVFTEIEEIIHPARTALLVIDVQNDFCSRGGVYAEMGKPVETLHRTIGRIRALIDAARRSGTVLVYVQNSNLPKHGSTSAPYVRYRSLKRSYGNEREPTIVGSWGWEILAEVGCREGDLVVTKHRSSAFAGTDLDQLLRRRKVQSVVLCGVTTDGCIESTARAAEALDYYVVVAADACAAFPTERHDESIRCMRHRYDVVDTSTIEQIWRGETLLTD